MFITSQFIPSFMGKDILQHNSEYLQSLLTKIDTGAFRIPSFQRDYVWKKKDVLRLLDSIFHEYPSGSLLLLNYNVESSPIKFDIKSFYGSNAPTEKCSCLVLDGQQRLTSCYHVFYDKSKSYRYFIDLKKLYEQWSQFSGDPDSIDFVSCIITKNERAKTNHVENDLLPFSLIKTQESYSTQRAAYEDILRDEDADPGYYNFIRINLDSLLSPFLNYKFSTIELPENLKASAVCRIFETLNDTGMKLDAFDICVARYMREGLDLKSKISTAKRQYAPLKILFDKNKNRELVLQTIALSTGAKSHLKNKLVESLSGNTIEDHWDEAISMINETLNILDDVGVGTKSSLRLLPYPAIIPAISAAMIHAGYNNLPVKSKAKINKNIQIFYFTSSLTQRYTQGAASRMKEDYDLLAKWFAKDVCPEFITEGIKWLDSEMRKVSNQYNAVSCAVYAILNHNGPTDFYYSNKKISVIDENTDLHHIFPKKRYGTKYSVNCVFNIAAISSGTNESINSDPTFIYAKEAIDNVFDGNEEQFKKAVMSQLISSEGYNAFMDEDYDTFIQKRMESVILALREVGVNIVPAREGDLSEEEIEKLHEETKDDEEVL